MKIEFDANSNNDTTYCRFTKLREDIVFYHYLAEVH